MGYISTRMMECEDAFSDMGSLKQNLELPPEYAYEGGWLFVFSGQALVSWHAEVSASTADEDSELEDAMVLGSTPNFGSTPRI